MKIDKNTLRHMIIVEVDASMRVSTQDDPGRVMGEFETNAFTSHVNAISGNLRQMRQIVEEDTGLDEKSLRHFKKTVLGALYQAVQSVENAIDLRLDPPQPPGGLKRVG